MIEQAISDLFEYARIHLQAREEDRAYLINVLMQKLGLAAFTPRESDLERLAAEPAPDGVIAPVLEYAKAQGLVAEGEEEFFTAELLDALTPRPSEVLERFRTDYALSPEKAFDGLYDLGVKNDYVKLSAINRNKCWVAEGSERKIEITINLSKPEKNNKQTAKLKNVSAGYPKCMLCRENVGYVGQGRTRRNMRTVPLKLDGEDWFWQYSPYAYFHQHGIAINAAHTPMEVNARTFRKVLDFVDYAPQYFIGSNAPLPIVGGSILAHEHFQGGKHVFPMFLAPTAVTLNCPEAGVNATLPDWYNSVVLLEGADKESVARAAERILDRWLDYSDESVGIVARTDAPHNTLAPIARRTEKGYALYLQLRNNRCDEAHPDGIFHAHAEYHNVKSESIGLIEAMGRFILPGRLDRQLKEIEKFLTGENTEISEDMKLHENAIRMLTAKHGVALDKEAAHAAVISYVEEVCERILDDTAVFKRDEKGRAAFLRFLNSCGYEERKA